MSRATGLQLYTSSIAILGLVVILIAIQRLPEDSTQLLVFAGLGIITELLSVELFANMRGSRLSAAAIISIAGVLTFGPLPAALINGGCGLTSSIVSLYTNRKQASTGRASFLKRTLFNVGMLTASTFLAGSAYLIAGGVVGDPLRLSNILPLFLAVVTSEASNILILLGVILLQTGEPIQQVWEQNFRWSIPLSVVGGVLGSLAIAIASAEYGWIGLALFFLPVLAIGYSFRMYLSNMRVYVNRLEQANTDMDEMNTALLETLGAVIDAYDLYTYGHSSQVAVYASALADHLGITGPEKSVVVRAALVHDIGKVGVMDSIIGKPDRLTDEERRLMERHPIISADILRQMKGLQELIPLVRHHHERWDGTGYPAGLAGDEIPLGARIIAVADAVDAMCSSRPYRSALPIGSVLQEVQRCSGAQFDPHVAQAFIELAAEKEQSYFKDSAESIDAHVGSKNILASSQGLRYLKRSMLPEDVDAEARPIS